MAITAGDPCGIGPEVILKVLADRPPSARARLAVIGELAVFARTAAALRIRLPAWRLMRTDTTPNLPLPEDRLVFLDCPSRGPFAPGVSSARAGAASLIYLERAFALWRAGCLDALVTAPVTKWAVAATAPGFRGHTEYLARAMGARHVVMLFVSDRLRIALLTRHVPLRQVGRMIDRVTLRTTLRLLAQELRTSFGCRHPKIALCGINPHAGEAGYCGTEEERVVVPVLEALRRQGVRCDGPFAADGFFAQAHHYDAVVCAYHDQGLIPFKMLSRDAGCQLSVGLPIIRTSPDHGSALDLAGAHRAHPGSMRYALDLAVALAHRRARSARA